MAILDAPPDFDLYAELGVDPGADRGRIDAAFRRLMKQHHPDVARDPVAGERRGKRLNIARHWLIDPERRGRYDRSRGLARMDRGARLATTPVDRSRVRRPPAGTVASGPPFGAIFLIGLMLVAGSLLASASTGPGAMMTLVSFPIGVLMLLYGGAGVVFGLLGGPPRR